MAQEVLAALEERKADFQPIYDADLRSSRRSRRSPPEIYGADGVDYTTAAERSIAQCEAMGLGQTPVCIAKTQYSFSDDPGEAGTAGGVPDHHPGRHPLGGAGFIVALAGDIMTMPGLSKTPAAENIRVMADGTIEGLF